MNNNILTELIDIMHSDLHACFFDAEQHPKNTFQPTSNLSDYSKIVYYAPSLLVYGDYTGCSVTRSNHEVFYENFKNMPWLEVYKEMHNSKSLLINIKLFDSIEALKTLKDLENYPLINEEHHSNLENDLEWEAWESIYRSDFSYKLVAHLENNTDFSPKFIEKVELLCDAALFSLFQTLKDATNTYFSHETGCECSIDLDRLINPIGTSKTFDIYHNCEPITLLDVTLSEQTLDKIIDPYKYHDPKQVKLL